VAESLEDALFIANANPPDLIILDLRLPDSDGVNAFEKLKSEAHLKDTPVIIVTATQSAELRQKALWSGANDFVTKPILKTDFIPRIRRFIG
jgi:putative two-component system response regulator